MAAVYYQPAHKGGLLFTSVLMGVLSLIFFGSTLYLLFLNERFAREGVDRVTGVVDQIKVEPGHRTTTYVAFFHYSLFHDNYYTRSQVAWQTAAALRVGGLVPVKYLRASPRTCRVDLPQEDRREVRLFWTFLIAAALFGLICVSFVWCYRRWPGGFN